MRFIFRAKKNSKAARPKWLTFFPFSPLGAWTLLLYSPIERCVINQILKRYLIPKHLKRVRARFLFHNLSFVMLQLVPPDVTIHNRSTSLQGSNNSIKPDQYYSPNSKIRTKTSKPKKSSPTGAGNGENINGNDSDSSSDDGIRDQFESINSLNGEIPPTNVPKVSLSSSPKTIDYDSLLLPIKNQITTKKISSIVITVVLIRLLHLSVFPTTHFNINFPYLPTLPIPKEDQYVSYSILYTQPNSAGDHQDRSIEQTLIQHFQPYWLFRQLTRAFALLFVDAYELHAHVLSSPILVISFVVCFALFPLTSYLDDRIHIHFYDRKLHRNTFHMPFWLQYFGKKGFKLLRYTIYALAVWPFATGLLRETNLVLVLCTMWMSAMKRVIKNIVNSMHLRSALRPPNQYFPRGLYFGGFPSGHISQPVVGLVIIGYIYGLSNVISYILIAQMILTSIWVIVGNRHYLTQVVAGIALGCIYGAAAITWLELRFGSNLHLSGVGHGWDII